MPILALVEGWLGPRFAHLAKPLLIGIGVLLLAGALFAAVKLHDARVVKNHDANQAAATATADRQADTNVAEQRRVDDARLTNETTEVNNAVSEAKRAGVDPRAAYYRCVRLQQAARAAKRVQPACH